MNSLAVPLVAIGILAGCDGTGDAPRTAAGPRSPSQVAAAPVAGRDASRAVPAWDATRCGDDEYRNARMERHPALMDRSVDDLIGAYGKPHADTRFRAGEGVGTYSGGVASQLPGGAMRNARTPVREIVWQRAGCNFVVRFREAKGGWRVFDAFEASADADF